MGGDLARHISASLYLTLSHRRMLFWHDIETILSVDDDGINYAISSPSADMSLRYDEKSVFDEFLNCQFFPTRSNPTYHNHPLAKTPNRRLSY